MKRLILLCALLVPFFLSSPALAVGEYMTYFGLDYVLSEYNPDSGPSVDLDAVAAKFGSYFNKNAALEARLGFSVSDENVDGVNYEFDNFVGLYVRGVIPFQTVELYGIVGVTRADLSISKSSEKDSGLSYGAGVDFRVGERVGLGMEYMMLIDNSDYEIRTINLGAKYFF